MSNGKWINGKYVPNNTDVSNNTSVVSASIRCPNCGAMIEPNSNKCSYCNSPITLQMQQEQVDIQKNQEYLNKQKCPKCNSTNIEFKRENQGEIRNKKGKQIIHKTIGYCRDCGYTWTPTNQQTTKKDNTIWWILGWIFFFPIPLTILLYRNKTMSPKLKYCIIGGLWLFVIIIGLTNNKNSAKSNEQNVNMSTEATTENQIVETETTTEKQITESDADYIITAGDVGKYGKIVTLNANTDMPVDKYLYKIPAGNYKVTTDYKKLAGFNIVKDEITIEPDNSDYPETLDYVDIDEDGNGYQLTAGNNDFNGHAKKEVYITLNDDESISIPGDSYTTEINFYFYKQ